MILTTEAVSAGLLIHSLLTDNLASLSFALVGAALALVMACLPARRSGA